MSVSINVSGERALAAAMKSMQPKVQDKINRKGARKAAKPVLEGVKDTVPVRTGLLKSSLRIRALKRSRKSTVVGVRITTLNNDAFYIKFLETGTKTITARHYMLNALHDNSSEVFEIFKREVKKFIGEEARKAAAKTKTLKA